MKKVTPWYVPNQKVCGQVYSANLMEQRGHFVFNRKTNFEIHGLSSFQLLEFHKTETFKTNAVAYVYLRFVQKKN